MLSHKRTEADTTGEIRRCHLFTEYFSRSVVITLVQGSFTCFFCLADILCHIYDKVFSQGEDLQLIFAIGGSLIVIAVGVNFYVSRYYWKKEKNGDPSGALLTAMEVLPTLPHKLINCLSSDRKTFADFNHYADRDPTIKLLMGYDKLIGFSICLFAAMGYTVNLRNVPGVTNTTNSTDLMNLFAFLFLFCCPLYVVVTYSVSVRRLMLERAIKVNTKKADQSNDSLVDPVTKSKAEEEQVTGSCSTQTAKLPAFGIIMIFVVRSAYFVIFDYWGFWPEDFTHDVHQPMYYLLAAAILFVCHVILSWHTLRKRTEWYDCSVAPQTGAGSMGKPRAEDGSFMPRGVDVYFSTTHFLSASLFARAVFGAIVLHGEQGPEHRVTPVFFDLWCCFVLIISFRYFLFSDYILLDLMSGSPALQRRKLEPDAEILNALIPSGVNHIFTTTIPIY